MAECPGCGPDVDDSDMTPEEFDAAFEAGMPAQVITDPAQRHSVVPMTER